MDDGDVRALNLLQAVSADESLYFNHAFGGADARALVRKAAKYRRDDKVVMSEYRPKDVIDADRGFLLALHRRDVQTGLRLRCVSVSPHAAKYDPQGGPVPYRDPAAVAEQGRRLIAEHGLPPMPFGDYVPVTGPPTGRNGSNPSRR